MDSINKNQPEHTRDDLRGPEAVAQIREIVGKAKNCFFCTSMGNKLISDLRNKRLFGIGIRFFSVNQFF